MSYTTKGRFLVAAAAVAALGFTAYGLASNPDKALVYCPVGIDTAGCDNIVNALSSADGPFPGGVNRGYDGTSGTIDLATADLSQYAVFVVPSLADGAESKPYEVLRNRKVAYNLSTALRGRLAVWSGTPDQGSASRTEKDRLIRNLAVWARGDTSATERGGIVVLQDHSEDASKRYAWMEGFAGMKVGADTASEVYDTVQTLTATATEILDNGSGQQLTYASMASFGLQSPAAATGAAVDARGGASGGQVVLVTSPKRRATIQTDRADYSPGDTVVFTGSGWQPGETVNILLREDPQQHADTTLTAVADADGNIVNKEYTPEEHDIGTTYYVTATGQGSALAAQTTFTDAANITVSKHQGQQTNGEFASGNVEGYTEGDFITFRFVVDADKGTSGQLQIRFTGQEAGCTFFTNFFELVKVENISGSTPTVTVASGPTLDQASGEYVVTLDIAANASGGGSAFVYYKLKLSDQAGDCSGASQHTRLNPAPGSAAGDVKQSGEQNVPVPANKLNKLATITVTKKIDRDGDGTFESTAAAGEFEFCLNGTTCALTNASGQVKFEDLKSGQYTITEQQKDFSQGTYQFVSGSGTNCTFTGSTATATVESGRPPKDATCTFNNGVVKGTLIIEKQTDPAGEPGPFSFTSSTTSEISGQIGDDGKLTFSVKPGTHVVTEGDPTAQGFDLTAISCSDQTAASGASTVDVPNRTATFNVQAGETVTCTFTNTKRGKIVVEKQTNPDGAQGSFTFTGAVSGTISDNGTIEATVRPGTHTVTENETPGFDLTAISCSDANSSGSVETRTATFRVEAGETLRCTFTNTKRGEIVVRKQTDPDQAAGSFTFEVDGTTSAPIGDNGELTFSVKPGAHTVIETDPTPQGFDLTAISCTETATANSSTNVDTRTASLQVEAGETVTCTFTNVKRGRIVVEKQTEPDGASGTFTFSGAVSGQIGDNGTLEAQVRAGEYHVAEADPGPNFDLVAISCDDATSANASSGNVAAREATFRVEAGETVKCTFTNRQRGKVIIEKQTDPEGAQGSFSFNFDGSAKGSISDNGQIVIEHVVPGTHTLVEGETPGFDLTAISCSDQTALTGASTVDVESRTATVSVQAGEEVKCTFTNTQRGKIIIEKQTDPDQTAGKFAFSVDGAAKGEIGDNGTITVEVKPGTHTVAEADPTGQGFDLTAIDCGAGGAGNVATREATVTVAAGATVTCTFTNTKRGQIEIIKKTVGGDGSFTFTTTGGNQVPPSFTITTQGGTGSQTFTTRPGDYTVTETVAAGFDLTALTCTATTGSSGAQDAAAPEKANITLAAGGKVTCTFENTKQGQVVIEKRTEGGDGTFTFTGDVFVGGSGTVTTVNGQGSLGPFAVRGGTQHTVTEEAPTGFDLTEISCSDQTSADGASTVDAPNRTATFNVQAGETVTCTFTNVKRGEVVVRKQTEGEAAGAQQASFDFTFDGQAFTLSGGTQQSFEVRGGTAHTVEELQEAGFDLTALRCEETVTANSTTTVNTNGEDGPAGTAQLKVEAGETVTCTFTNTKRGKIVVEKQTNPDNAPGQFTFTGAVSGTISDNGTLTAEVKPGTHIATEDETAGFDLTAISCDDATSANASSGDVEARQATFRVEAGETVTCTFTNTQRGKVVIKKKTEGGDGSFTFTGPTAVFGASGSTTITTTGGQGTFGPVEVKPNTYEVTEQATAGFDLTAIECSDQTELTGQSTVDLVNGKATFNVQAGETVTCTFTNTKRGKIVVEKQTNPDNAPGSFTFTGTVSGTISDNGTLEAEVKPGVHTATEGETQGFDLTAINCTETSTANSSGNVTTRTATFNVEAGETVKCTFTNTQRGKVIIEKQTQPEGATVTFTFTFDNAPAGTIGDNQQITIENVKPGEHTGTELDPGPAFELISIVCNDANSSGTINANGAGGTATIRVEAGETVKCTFTNRERSAGKVTGGGQITIGASGRGNFGFVAQRKALGDLTLAGSSLQYHDHTNGMNVHGQPTWLVIMGNKATFGGTCTHKSPPLNIPTPCTFEVEVEDNGEPGKGKDTFGIQVFSSVYLQAPQRITRGNIQIHKQP